MLGAAVTLIGAVASGFYAVLTLTVVFAAATTHSTWDRWRRRRAWLAECKKLRSYGRPLSFVIQDGVVVQVTDAKDLPAFHKAAVVVTPRG
jgi:hypothetical protein